MVRTQGLAAIFLVPLCLLCLVGLSVTLVDSKAYGWCFLKMCSLLEKDVYFSKRFFLKEYRSYGNFDSRVSPQNAIQTQFSLVLFCLQGTRVWLRENGQHFPSTVNSCAEGVVVFRTDYGQVRASPCSFPTSVICSVALLAQGMCAWPCYTYTCFTLFS